jgi:hypothetical protein
LPARDSFFSQLRYIRHSKAECDDRHGFQELLRRILTAGSSRSSQELMNTSPG